MSELSVPLSLSGIDPIHEFLTEGLIRQGFSTALRLPLLAVLEELIYAALALCSGRDGQAQCVLTGPGEVRLSFHSSGEPVLPDPEELSPLLNRGLSLHNQGGSYIFSLDHNS